MGQLKKLAGQTVIYGASTIIGRVLNYLLVPLYTKVFAESEYGVVTELYAYVAFFNILFTYGFETAYFRFASKSDQPINIYNVAQSSMLFSSIIFCGFLILFSDSVANVLDYAGNSNYIIWLALVLATDAIVGIPFARLRLEGRAKKFGILKIMNILVNIGLNSFFLLYCPAHSNALVDLVYNPNLGVGYVFLSNLIANALYLLFFIPWLTKIKITFGKVWKDMMIYAWPLLVLGLAGVTNEMFSRVLLKYWLPEGFYPGYTNDDVLGIFGACYKIAVFMTLAVQAFRYSLEPFFFSKSADKNSPRLFAVVMHAFIIFGCFAWLIISLFLQDFAPIFLRRESYLSGLSIVPWLLGGGLFLGIYFNLSIWYKLTDKTIYGAYITLAGSVVTVLLNILLIPVLGYDGSAITTFVSYLVMVVISYFLGQKYYFIPYLTGRGVYYILFTALSIWGFGYLEASFEYKYLVSAGLILLFLASVWWIDIRSNTFRNIN